MAEIYDAIEKDVLPQLRKAKITIRSFEPKNRQRNFRSCSK